MTTKHPPVLFLNPIVVIEDPPQHVSFSRQAQEFTMPGAGVALGNAAVIALGDLSRRIGAPIVMTAAVGGYDPRDQLLSRGLPAGLFAPAWSIDMALPDRGAAIQRWSEANGPIRPVILDRVKLNVVGSIMVTIPNGFNLTAETAAQIAHSIGAAAADAARNA